MIINFYLYSISLKGYQDEDTAPEISPAVNYLYSISLKGYQDHSIFCALFIFFRSSIYTVSVSKAIKTPCLTEIFVQLNAYLYSISLKGYQDKKSK